MIDIPDSIFPTDNAGKPVCPKCKKSVESCVCPTIEPAKPRRIKIIPVVRLERSGRKGKVVTMIEGLPRIEALLRNLAKDLKARTGSGGTYYLGPNGGVVEIQGDHQKIIKQMFLDGKLDL